MAHCIVEAAEQILDKEYKVLDKGFVRLVDYMGSDERIVQAARVSYGKGTKTYREDSGLISYLLRNEHTSPFEQVIFTFHIKLPIFVARQWIRHRTARVNEISGRYSVMEPEFYVPENAHISFQSINNKQGRSADEVEPWLVQEVSAMLESSHQEAYKHYEWLLSQNIARELARVVLPLSLYTEWYWQIDLHNLLRFLLLRLDAHAQLEIRKYAEVLFDIGKLVCPAVFEAFDEHMLNAVHFSKTEKEALANMLAGNDAGLSGRANERFMEKIMLLNGSKQKRDVL